MMTNYSASRPDDDVDETLELITITKVINFSYTWIISTFQLDFEIYQSPMFSNETNNEIKWRLRLEKHENAISHEPYGHTTSCSIELALVSDDVNKLQTNCKFKILSAIPNKTIQCSKPLQFITGIYTFCFETEEKINILDPANGYLQMDAIMIICDINVQNISKILSIPRCSLHDNLDFIYENRKFSDVTLCALDKDLAAHKVILAARSPVFRAMFENNMGLHNNNRVDVSYIKGDVFEELLRFIYTGKVVNLENLANDLLPAANKYGLERLKVLCGKALWKNISIENAAEVLVLVDMCGLDQFKAAAIGFIGSHVADVTETTGWETMIRSHPNLVTEIICDLSQQLNEIISGHES